MEIHRGEIVTEQRVGSVVVLRKGEMMTEQQVAFARKVEGYMAVKDFLDGNIREEELTVKAVEFSEQHPLIRGARYFLRFNESEEVLVLNRINEGIMRGAYRNKWSSRKILLRPVERIWSDMTPIWGLEIVPLVRCKECKSNYTIHLDTSTCEICHVINK